MANVFGVLLALQVDSTVAGVALQATEDALKLGFALGSLDSPGPFEHKAPVPDAVRDAIR